MEPLDPFKNLHKEILPIAEREHQDTIINHLSQSIFELNGRLLRMKKAGETGRQEYLDIEKDLVMLRETLEKAVAERKEINKKVDN